MKTNTNEKEQNELSSINELSSRIKSVYVELKDYTFFHRPTGVKQKDDRFIGREKVIDKLKAILTNSEAKSGAYLITGFRGMGKTSIVNKVLAELNYSTIASADWNRWGRIFMVLLIFSIFNVPGIFSGGPLSDKIFIIATLLVSPLLILCFALIYFVRKDPYFDENKLRKKTDYLKHLFDPLFPDTTHSIPNNTFWQICRDYVAVSILHVMAMFILFLFFDIDQSKEVYTYTSKFQSYVFSFLLTIAYVWLVEKNIIKKSIGFLFGVFVVFLLCVCFLYALFAFVMRSAPIIYEGFRLGAVIALFILFVFIYRKKIYEEAKLLIPLVLLFCFVFIKAFFLFLDENAPFIYLKSLVDSNFFLFATAGLSLAIYQLAKYFKDEKIHISNVERFFNFSHIINIKINLGQENLKESEILKLIAKSIYGEYAQLVRPFSNLRRSLWVFIWIFGFYVLALTFFYYRPTYSLVNELREDLLVTELFPSQSVFAHGEIDYNSDREKTDEMEEVERKDSSFLLLDYFDIIYEGNALSRYHTIRTLDSTYLNENKLDPFLRSIMTAGIDTTLIKQKVSISDLKRMNFLSASNRYSIRDSTLLKAKNNLDSKDSSLIELFPITARLDYLFYETYTDFSHFIIDLFFSEASFGNDNPTAIANNSEENIETSLFSATLDLHENFHIIPPRLDYFLVIYLIFFFTLITQVSRIRFFGVTHKMVIKELRNLMDDIDASSVTAERGGNAKVWSLGFFRKRSRTYSVRTAREIETRLIHILALSEKIPAFRMRPKFVFVFDELDKIEPHTEGSSDTEDNKSSLDSYISEGTKKRQEAIGRILSNLKHFFNTADAKFMFIAGREMYDASLADISDRDSLIGSLFHDVIYVNSFYKDPSDKRLSDVTSMTERYVCKFLMPKQFLDEQRAKQLTLDEQNEVEALKAELDENKSTLFAIKKIIKSFLEKMTTFGKEKAVYYFNKFRGAKKNLEEEIKSQERELKQLIRKSSSHKIDYNLYTYNLYLKEEFGKGFTLQMRFKILTMLQNFITYLTYRSNGSPKKLTKIFEEYIIKIRSDESFKDLKSNALVISKNRNSLHLRIGFYDQYVFGFSNYLFNPFLLAVNKYLKDFGDKLLVSTSFLLNHMYKFHNSGFSYRTLELTPEIIAINKAPELRGFIDRLLRFLGNTHIREIISGLHQFKYHSKIEKEITFMSKISEKESAAYNFTLDESTEIKRIYRKRLTALNKDHENETKFSPSVAYLNLIIGDLYYHDQEYDQALIHYKDSTRNLRNLSSSEFKLDALVFYLRAELKLGITFEKKRNYDDALLIYENLRIKIESFTQAIKKGEKAIKESAEENTSASQAKLSEEGPVFESIDSMYQHLASEIVPGLRLFFQPLVVTLQTIEKHTVKSLTAATVEMNVNRFKKLIDEKLEMDQVFLIKAEYYDKIGDILFYKNGSLVGEKEAPKFTEGMLRIKSVNTIDEENKKKTKDQSKEENEIFYLPSIPISAYKHYMLSLCSLINYGIDNIDQPIMYFNPKNPEDSEKFIIHYFTYYLFLQPGKSENIQKRKNFYHAAGNSLSDAADCILCSLNFSKDKLENYFKVENLPKLLSRDLGGALDRKTSWTFWEGPKSEDKRYFEENGKRYLKDEFEKDILNKYTYRVKNGSKVETVEYTRFEIALRYIYTAASMYIQAGEYSEYTFQLSKILYLTKMILGLKWDKDELSNERKKLFLDTMHDKVVTRSIRSVYRSYENNNNAESEKLKLYFSEENNEDEKRLAPLLRTATSASEDVKELLMAYKELELKLRYNRNSEKQGEFNFRFEFINPYSNISSKHNRILELNLRARYNYIEYERIHDLAMTKVELAKLTFGKTEALCFLVNDSIFCLYEIIKSLNIYGISYIHNHSWLASSYKKLAEWVDRIDRDDLEQKEEIIRLIGQIEYDDLDSNSLNERAIQHYYLMLEMHSEGGAYKETIEKMYYLDDNFNDNLYHFCATLERVQINSGFIKKQINTLESSFSKAAIFSFN